MSLLVFRIHGRCASTPPIEAEAISFALASPTLSDIGVSGRVFLCLCVLPLIQPLQQQAFVDKAPDAAVTGLKTLAEGVAPVHHPFPQGFQQGIEREDILTAELLGPNEVKITNPAGQYMHIRWMGDHAEIV